MLSLTELKRVVGLLAEDILGHRLQGVVQPNGSSAVLTVYGAGEKRHLFFCCDRENARVSQVGAYPELHRRHGRSLPDPLGGSDG